LKTLSLEAKVSLLLVFLIGIVVSIVTLSYFWFDDILLAALISLAIALPVGIIIIRSFMKPINQLLSALYHGYSNFLDNDFSVSLSNSRNDELGDLVDVYNRVGDALRNERVHLYQRELLLETVMQSSPLSLVLTENSGAVIYSNNASRKLFNHGKSINGTQFEKLLDNMPRSFMRSLQTGLNGLFTVSSEHQNDTYHLTQNNFILNGKKHKLYIFKQLTKEINRQEVNTWKKVIRVISHELNNSLAPISSLAHSGQVLSERLQQEKLKEIFATMEERATYLKNFIEGYAEFARLPKPNSVYIDTDPFLKRVKSIYDFDLELNDKSDGLFGDPAQLQQAIVNLLKNAHESGSDKNDIKITVKSIKNTTELQILDRGTGMSDKNLKNALLPFYSTKQKGTGLGLPLCREIIEAHGGKMLLNNRTKKGLAVIVILPFPDPSSIKR